MQSESNKKGRHHGKVYQLRMQSVTDYKVKLEKPIYREVGARWLKSRQELETVN